MMGSAAGGRKHGKRAWYLARLLYIVAVSKTGSRLRVEEDLWLIDSADICEAKSELIQGGRAAAAVGRLLRKNPSYGADLARLKRLLVSSPQPTPEGQVLKFDPGRLAAGGSRATVYEFWGVRTLRCVGSRIYPGMELEVARMGKPRGRRGSTITANAPDCFRLLRRDDLVDSSGGNRQRPALEWYVAEQLFEESPVPVPEGGRSQGLIKRLALVRASTFKDAFIRSVRNAESWQQHVKGVQFLGLPEISRVEGPIRSCTVLRTDEYSTSAKLLGQTAICDWPSGAG